MSDRDDPGVRTLLGASELDTPRSLELRRRVEAWAEAPPELAARRYPGYPRRLLPRVHPRPEPGLEEVLVARRSARALAGPVPDEGALARVLALSHGVWAPPARGPAPSAGDLQALELYAVVLGEGWLARGVHHYERAAHALVRVGEDGDREAWDARLPSLGDLGHPPVVLLVVGETTRVEAKYGPRGARLLLLEAGHLGQNLVLAAGAVGLGATPLGGIIEGAVARALALPPGDAVLYGVALGHPAS